MAERTNRHTIGLLIDQIHNEYHNKIWTGIADAAEKLDANLIIYCGKSLNYDEFYESSENLVYGLVNLDHIDGLILSSGTLTSYISTEGFIDFIKPYMGIHLVSHSLILPGIPSICIDNKSGMKGTIDHLIETHGCKRIAYISGPEVNMDSQIRFKAYRESLVEHNIPLDENLILPGDFTEEAGVRAVEILMNERKIECEAIACANDAMAFGALEMLKEKGIRVPQDIALTGFDDIEAVEFSLPPITSVRQPIKQMSEKTVEMLIDLIEGKMVKEQVVFPATPVIRRSCGCLPLPEKIIKKNADAVPGVKKVTALHKEKFAIIAREICAHFGLSEFKTTQYTPHIIHLLTHLIDDISGSKAPQFLLFLNNIMSEMLTIKNETVSWQDIIYSIRDTIIRYVTDVGEIKRIEELLHQAQIQAANISLLKERYRKHIHTLEDEAIWRFYSRVHSTSEQEKLFSIILSAVQHFGIQRCFISLFEHTLDKRIHPFELNPENKSRLLISIMGNQSKIHGDKEPLFPSRNLIPDEYIPREERFSWVVRILYSQEVKFGFIVFDLNTRATNILATLHEMFCSGFMMIHMLKKRVAAEMELRARTKELEELNKKLEELDDLKNEFIANITHDFRSTLMIILNTADIGIKYYSAKGSMLGKKFTTIFNTSLKLKTTIDKLLELGKMDTRGVKLNICKVNFKKFIASIIDFYKSTALFTKIKVIDILPPGEIDNVYTDTEKLEEVLYNVISNAFKFVDPETGVIQIECKDFTDSIQIIISDNGIGIPRNKLEDIFKRFVQVDNRKNSLSRGTGIGLAFARQLMGFLKGRIWAESEGEGRGTRFYVELKKGKEIYHREDFSDVKAESITISEDREKLLRMLQSQISNEKITGEGYTAILRSLNTEEEYTCHKGIILIVEDNEHIRNIEKEYLERAGYLNFILAEDGRSGIHAAYLYRPDLIICDYNMPNMKGDEFHEELVHNPDFVSIPIIFVTAIADSEVLIERRKKGAIAVLPKPIDENDFLLTVGVNLKRYLKFKKTIKQANIDKLTGLNNRQTILQFLKNQVSSRSYHHISLIFLDIDHFKQINDEYGHQAGDKVLSSLGSMVKKTIRSSDIAGRYGGEEFLIILPDTTIDEAFIAAEKLKKKIYSIPIMFADRCIAVSASFGISSLIDNRSTLCKRLGIDNLKELFEVSESKKVDVKKINEIKLKIGEHLISMADQAMYKAKRTVCTSCGFSSEKETFFAKGNCPKCRKKTIIKGRNRIVPWEDDTP